MALILVDGNALGGQAADVASTANSALLTTDVEHGRDQDIF